jgi:membrane protein YqaA with SNARE-associated domain
MLRKLYDWVLSLAAKPRAEWWLAFIAFVESSVFLVPADVLFLPMALSKPAKAYRFALIATVFSVLGGIAGYFLGYFAYETIAKPVLQFYGKAEQFEAMKACASGQTLMVLLVTSGLAHLPPIKIVTILAGVAQISFPLFVISCVVARGARFFALAWAIKKWGEPIKGFIENRLGLIAGVVAAAIVAAYFAVKAFGGSGGFSC